MSIMHLCGRKYLIDRNHFSPNRKCSDCFGKLNEVSTIEGRGIAFAYNDEDAKNFNGMIYCIRCFTSNGNHRKNIDIKSKLEEFIGGIPA